MCVDEKLLLSLNSVVEVSFEAKYNGDKKIEKFEKRKLCVEGVFLHRHHNAHFSSKPTHSGRAAVRHSASFSVSVLHI